MTGITKDLKRTLLEVKSKWNESSRAYSTEQQKESSSSFNQSESISGLLAQINEFDLLCKMKGASCSIQESLNDCLTRLNLSSFNSSNWASSQSNQFSPNSFGFKPSSKPRSFEELSVHSFTPSRLEKHSHDDQECFECDFKHEQDEIMFDLVQMREILESFRQDVASGSVTKHDRVKLQGLVDRASMISDKVSILFFISFFKLLYSLFFIL